MIRPATVADARAIAEVHVASWRGAYRGLLPDETLAALDIEVRAARWMRSIVEGRYRLLVVEGESGVYGFASIGRSRDPDAGDEVGELLGLYLHPDSWGLGLGRALHDSALETLRGEGFVVATLWVLAGNEQARRFYEHAGWRRDGSEKTDRIGELRTPVDEVRYRLALRPSGS